MPETPSVTRQYLEDRSLIREDLNLSLIWALYDYRNEFTFISAAGAEIENRMAAIDVPDLEDLAIKPFLEKRQREGYHVQEFRVREIFSTLEISKIDPVLIEDAERINTLSAEINALGTELTDIAEINYRWKEIDRIISSRRFSYTSTLL